MNKSNSNQMALLSSAKGRKDPENSGYFRIFAEDENDQEALALAKIISKIHATGIKNGNLLDSQIIPSSNFNPNNPKKGEVTGQGHFWQVVFGKKKLDYVTVTDNEIHVYEIKDGDNFDTKKSQGEYAALRTAKAHFAAKEPSKKVYIHVVCWNAKRRDKISFKVCNLPAKVLMTGRDFCERYGLDFAAIAASRRNTAAANKAWLRKALEVLDD